MDLQFTSVEQLWERAESNLRAHQEQNKKPYDPALLKTPEYTAWVDDIAKRHRERGLLLTKQQLADLKRPLRAGDKARYVGPTTIERTSTGAEIPRPTGQEGVIIEVSGNNVITFQPIITQAQRETETGGEIVRLVTKEWRLFERIP